jgi:hypothetical protein
VNEDGHCSPFSLQILIAPERHQKEPIFAASFGNVLAKQGTSLILRYSTLVALGEPVWLGF